MTVKQFPLTLANGQQIISVYGAGFAGGAQQVVFAASGAAPGSGTIQLEYQLYGSTAWLLADHAEQPASALPLAYPVYGNVQAYRVTKAGITGGSDLAMFVSDVQPAGFPDGAFTGLRALTTQPYTEANVKNGLQFFVRAAWPLADSIAVSTTRKLWFKTGSKVVIAKLRDFQYVAEELRIRLFQGPTGVTGGTDLRINNYNGVGPVATTVQAKKNVTTSMDGTAFGDQDDEYFFGASAQGQRTTASIPQGRERILPANTEFIVAIDNTGTGVARAQYYLDWYEGDPDLPLNP